MPRRRRLSPANPLNRIVDAWLFQLGTKKPSKRTLTAYRADIEGVARRIDTDGAAVLHLDDLTKPALRAGFASGAADHATASILRAHSAWTSLFDFLVADDLIEGNPMAAISKPPSTKSAPKAIKAEDAAARLLAIAATTDPAARNPWPVFQSSSEPDHRERHPVGACRTLRVDQGGNGHAPLLPGRARDDPSVVAEPIEPVIRLRCLGSRGSGPVGPRRPARSGKPASG